MGRLVAYVSPTSAADDQSLLRNVREVLPRYMVPSCVVGIQEWPINSSGKIDAKQLPPPGLPNRTMCRAPSEDPQPKSQEVIELEQWPLETFASLLKLPVETLDLHSNFFAQGGNSILALKLQKMVEGRTGMKFTTAQPLGANITAQYLMKLIAPSGSDDSSPSLSRPPNMMVMRDSGPGAPLWWLCTAGGLLFTTLPIVQAMKSDRPVYGLNDPWIYRTDENEKPMASMQEAVEFYAGQIVEQQPIGPYNIGGYSFGGALSFEVGKLLVSWGYAVDRIIIVDLPCTTLEQPGESVVMGYYRGITEGVVYQFADVCEQYYSIQYNVTKSTNAYLQKIAWSVAKMVLPAENYMRPDDNQLLFDTGVLKVGQYEMYNLLKHHFEIAKNYYPKNEKAPFSVLHITTKKLKDDHWMSLCTNGRRCYVEGSHVNLLVGERARTSAALVESFLAVPPQRLPPQPTAALCSLPVATPKVRSHRRPPQTNCGFLC